MRGAEAIIQARIRGVCPRFVFVNDYPCKTDWMPGEYPTVCTAHDPLSSLDLRFLTGLRVSVSATTQERAQALFERVKAAGAAAVAAVHVQTDQPYFSQSGWCATFDREAKND